MATISSYATKAGKRWEVRYRTPERVTTRKRGFGTKRDAEAFASTVEVSKLRGEFIDATAARATVGDLGPAWLGRQSHLKPSSFRSFESAWRVHVKPRWASTAVADVRSTEVQAWVSELSTGREATRTRAASAAKSPTTVIRAFGVLAAILDDAVKDRRVLTNAARGTRLPRKTRREHVYLSHQQVEDLARESKSHRTLVLVLAYCGLRWGEAAGLRVRDLDMLRRRLVVRQNAVEVGSVVVVGTPKTHKQRAVPFPRFLAEALARACEGKGPDELVFAGVDGAHMRRTRTDEASGGWFAGAVKRSGVPRVTPHDLRHTAASLAVSAGANVKAVQRMLGHASAAMTLDVYADLFDDDLEAVADALDTARSAQVVSKVRPNASGEG